MYRSFAGNARRLAEFDTFFELAAAEASILGDGSGTRIGMGIGRSISIRLSSRHFVELAAAEASTPKSSEAAAFLSLALASPKLTV